LRITALLIGELHQCDWQTNEIDSDQVEIFMTLDQKLVDEFSDNGFVLTDGLLKDNALTEYSAAVDAEVARRTRHDDRNVSDKTTYEQSFVQCMRLWETCDAVKKLSCDAGLASAAAQLLGVDSVMLWQDQALYKEAGGRETDAHQDQPFWPIGHSRLISAWIPFDDITQDNGAMSYVPGSHKAGKLKVVDITHTTKPYEILKDPALAGREPVSVYAAKGSVVWHEGFTVHQAAANNSNQTRRVFTIVYIAVGSKREKPWPNFPLDRAGVEVDGLVKGEGLPVVWPKPDQLPQTPDHIGGPTGPQA
jgi:ectoine hydroxylase-related dioxygenase (phytanoyl-CoA dioxygenase family)